MMNFRDFDPLWLATPISENFQTRWKFFFCYIQSDFGNKKFIEQCFHTLSASTLLKRKSLIDLTWETLSPLGDHFKLSKIPNILHKLFLHILEQFWGVGA